MGNVLKKYIYFLTQILPKYDKDTRKKYKNAKVKKFRRGTYVCITKEHMSTLEYF